MKNLKIITLAGNDIAPRLQDLAFLRIQIFKEFPYLYEGDLSYEMKYLKRYVDSSNSRVMLIYDNEKPVGATTSIPLKNEEPAIKDPFVKHGFDVNDYYYFGESLLLPAYRGQGIYRKFFDFRENAAKEQGCKKAVFMAVIRPDNHPRRPKDYQSLEAVWKHFGYHQLPELQIEYSWKDIDEPAETKKILSVWEKKL